jgi:hypothetical protein
MQETYAISIPNTLHTTPSTKETGPSIDSQNGCSALTTMALKGAA